EVVISAGTVGSAQLLLLSGIGPADQLQSIGIKALVDLLGVGKNLRCHPMLTLHFPTHATVAADPDVPRLVLVVSGADRNNLMLFPKQLTGGLSVVLTLRL